MPFSPELREFEMWISSAEFGRCLAKAFPEGGYQATADGARGEKDGRAWRIDLEVLPDRVVTSLVRCPRIMVRVALDGWPAPVAEAFMKHFHLAFQRGGG